MQDETTSAQWNTLADQAIVDKTIESLKANNINAVSVQSGEEAKQKVLELIPQGSEVMTMTSVTLQTIGVTQEINESGNYDAVHAKLAKMDRATQGAEMQKLGAAAE